MKRNLLATTAAAAAIIFSQQVAADQVILDDLIVDGSTCVGQDCLNGESFGFDTIRLKENNLRIKFQDTSNSASFPTNDWQLTANDSSNGGANKFSIDDIDGGRTPFTLEAGAPSHSLYVDDGGRLGLGTSTPVVDIHSVSGNTPTLRLEQNGSSGFTPQTWDMAGNEANFFIRDVTNGATLPFRIQPGAPSSSLSIMSDGKIGMGTWSPENLSSGNTVGGNNGQSAALHVSRTDGTGSILISDDEPSVITMLELRNGNGSRIRFEDTRNDTDDWIIGSNGSQFQISEDSSGVTEFLLSANGNLQIAGSLTTTGTTCGGGCDRVFTPEYKLESIEEHAMSMWDNQYLPAVGPTVENEPFNLTVMTGGMLNELEKAHIYIEQLNRKLAAKEKMLSDLDARFSTLEKQFANQSASSAPTTISGL